MTKRDKQLLNLINQKQITIFGGYPCETKITSYDISALEWNKRVSETQLTPICEWELDVCDIILLRGECGYYLMDDYGYWVLGPNSTKDLIDLLISHQLPKRINLIDIEGLQKKFQESIKQLKDVAIKSNQLRN